MLIDDNNKRKVEVLLRINRRVVKNRKNSDETTTIQTH